MSKYEIDIKLVYEAPTLDDTHNKLKETLKQIIDEPGLTIYIKNPTQIKYDKLVKGDN